MKNLIFVLASLLLVVPCAAEIIVVDDDWPYDFNNIQAAIDYSSNGDFIYVLPGIYTGAGNRDIDFKGKAVTVSGVTGDPNDCVIDCQGDVNEPHRGFKFVSGEDGNSVLEAITITNGYGPEEEVHTGGALRPAGGAIYCKGSSPTIKNCIIINNSVCENTDVFSNGGGICSSYGSPSIIDCIISNNLASDGGGIENNYGDMRIINCAINNNTAKWGGGMYNYDASPTLSYCLFSGNSATVGGMFNHYHAYPKLDSCVFTNNSDCGIVTYTYTCPTLVNCTLINNEWAGLEVVAPTSEVNSRAILQNCILWGNQSYQISTLGDAEATVSYSDIQGGWTGPGNIDKNPFLVNSYHLDTNSPCIDAGDPNYIAEVNQTDIDGDPRVVGRVDMGADEVYSGESALIVITSGVLNFEAEGLPSSPQSQDISIKNYGIGILNWQISESNDCNWLDVFPTTGQLNTEESNDIEITVNPNIAGYGMHSCQLQITSPDAENSPQVVTVNLEVLGPQIGVNNDYFHFTAYGKSDANVAGQELVITNTGFDILNWDIEISDCNWLNVFPTSGQVNAGESNDVEITVDINMAGYGTNSCQLQVTAPDAENSPQMVTVDFEVLGPQIGINKDYFYFKAYGKSDTSVAGQELIITNTGFDTLNWHIEVTDCNWLSVSPPAGQVTDGNSVVAITVDPNKVPAYGYNYATINIIDENASNSPQAVTVRLQVYGPVIYTNPPGGLYIYAESNTKVEGTFELINTGYDILHWNIETPNDCNWLTSVEPLSGEFAAGESDIVTVTVDTNGLENNDYHTQLLIHSPECNSKTVGLGLIVYTPSEIHVPQDYNTIQEAINAAVTGDIIIVHPGTYAGFNDNKAALTIRSIEPENQAVVAATIIESRGLVYGNGAVINGLSFIYNPNALLSDNGIYISKSSDVQIKNCRVLNFPRAGICVLGQYPAATISNCVISNNGSVGGYTSGGMNISGFANIKNCLITDNFGCGILVMGQCGAPGGGVKLYIRNSTIADNFYDTAKTAGRAITITCDCYPQGGLKLSLRNSVLSNVFGPNDVEIFIGAENSDNINLDIAYSNVRGGLAAVSTPIGANVVWGQGNIDADPCFADPCNGDYHLKSQGWQWDAQRKVWTWDEEVTSRCIDAGNPGSPLGEELMTIPDDPNNEWGENLRINMGAYGGTAEASMPPYDWALLADLTNDGVVNLEDFVGQAKDWLESESEQGGDLNRNGTVDINDLAIFVEDWLKQTSWLE